MSTTLDVCSGASAKRAAAAVTWGTAPVAAVMVQRLDVGEATAVPSAADAWAAAPHSPDVLADNTGPMSPARFVTAHGREGHMGVKQMGGLALTGFLLPAVEAPAGDRRRIVSVTSRPSATAYVETSVIVRAGQASLPAGPPQSLQRPRHAQARTPPGGSWLAGHGGKRARGRRCPVRHLRRQSSVTLFSARLRWQTSADGAKKMCCS